MPTAFRRARRRDRGSAATVAAMTANYHQFCRDSALLFRRTQRFVVRGGYGATSFFEGNSSNQRLTSITPFIQAVNVSNVAPTPGNPGTPRTAEEGFTAARSASGGTFNVYPKNIQPAYVQEWNLTTEYALDQTLSLQVGYLGEQGQHIEDYGNLNQYTGEWRSDFGAVTTTTRTSG